MKDYFREADRLLRYQNPEPVKTFRVLTRAARVTGTLLLLILMALPAGIIWMGSGIGVNNLFSGDVSERFSILIAGTDMDYQGQRTDTMFLGFIIPEIRKVELFSLPRDSRVNVENHGIRKLNSAYSCGGVSALTQAVEQNFLIKIDHHIVVNIDGFVNIIDILGGVTIDVEQDMNYDDVRGNLHIHLKKGIQLLNGQKAMEYVRFREKLFADLGRIKRQQKFLEALTSKFKDPEIIWKLPAIIREIRNNVKTDLSYETILKLANRFRNIDQSCLRIRTVPGEAQYIGKVSYFIADMEKFRSMLDETINGDDSFSPEQKQIVSQFLTGLMISTCEVSLETPAEHTAEQGTDNVSENSI